MRRQPHIESKTSRLVFWHSLSWKRKSCLKVRNWLNKHLEDGISVQRPNGDQACQRRFDGHGAFMVVTKLPRDCGDTMQAAGLRAWSGTAALTCLSAQRQYMGCVFTSAMTMAYQINPVFLVYEQLIVCNHQGVVDSWCVSNAPLQPSDLVIWHKAKKLKAEVLKVSACRLVPHTLNGIVNLNLNLIFFSMMLLVPESFVRWEQGVIIGTGNQLGKRIPVDEAEDHIFGLVLLNDWSARDLQWFEMFPLGPFNGKNFVSLPSFLISVPWLVSQIEPLPASQRGRQQLRCA